MKLKIPSFFYVKMNPISIHRLSQYVAAVITVSVIQSPLYISSDNSLQYFKRGKSSRVTAIIPLFIMCPSLGSAKPLLRPDRQKTVQ